MHFDLTDYKNLDNANIHKAELSLYALSHHISNYPKGDDDKKNGGKSVGLAPYPWNEEDLTWLNYGIGYDDQKTGNEAPRGTLLDTTNDKTKEMPIGCWETFDVTEGVKSIISKDLSNNGFMLSTLEGYKTKNSIGWIKNIEHRMGVNYASSEHGNVNLRPKLIIAYTPVETEKTFFSNTKVNNISMVIKNELLQIDLPNSGLSTISIYSISGKLLFKKTSSGTFKYSLGLNGILSKGVYVLVVNNSEISFKERFSY